MGPRLRRTRKSNLAISEAVAAVTSAAQGAKPTLIGHSLGGTLAAIYGAFLPESIRGLVLLGAPLCFEPSENQFRDALVTLVPREISASGETFPEIQSAIYTDNAASELRLIIVWLEVRVLPAPPHSLPQTEISPIVAE